MVLHLEGRIDLLEMNNNVGKLPSGRPLQYSSALEKQPDQMVVGSVVICKDKKFGTISSLWSTGKRKAKRMAKVVTQAQGSICKNCFSCPVGVFCRELPVSSLKLPESKRQRTCENQVEV